MTYTTYADAWAPASGRRSAAYNIGLILAGSVLVALCAQVAIPLPFSPVPVTGQTFGVLLVGALLGSRRGALALLTYVVEGIAGLPVFALGKVGPAILLGPTGGYLVGFIAAAWLVGYLSERGMDRRLWSSVVSMTAGTAVILFFGVTWLCPFTGLGSALALGCFPFLPGAVAKILLAAALLPAGWKLIGRRSSR